MARFDEHDGDMEDRSGATFSLGEYEGEKRLLLIFAPSKKSPSYEEQTDLLEGEEDRFAERDLLLGRILDQGRSSLADRSLSPEEVAALRTRFGLEGSTFRIVLVGKDGTVKRRDDAPLKPEAIYRAMDDLPGG